ncbi:uncharacterized protein LOC128258767 [Drosophila gunungcola]|uniref:Uncharacterized protein n=1 Tax=Drosophila gunungcola TaxID=103775 RepID=A0A9Q0BQ37_9MUSC|nr:uncharacterized protein LOC128258767 [Drosophila gunungcola]KAI8040562.1 hypothetical protein M5D96_006505 [Drosophila gunungcola]
MQQSQILRNLCFFVAFSSMAVVVLGLCNNCQENGVACLNETHYRFCSPNVAPNQIARCSDGQVCTSLGIICIEKGAYDPACSDSAADGSCPTCDGSSMFVCTSRTTFQMCDGSTLTSQVTKCKDNKICSIKSGKYCVDLCEAGVSVECDREAPL